MIFTLSNFLSVLRVLLLPPFFTLYSANDPASRLIAFVLVLIAISTDWLDGQVARWTNTVSDVGKVLDPLADKICAAAMVIFFVWHGDLPLWFAVLVLVRDVIIFAGGIYANQKKHVITTSLWSGKWAVGFIAMMMTLLVLPSPPFDITLLKEIFMGAATVLLIVSFIQYAARFRRILQGVAIQV